MKWDFPHVSAPIDASLYWNGYLFLFKENTYWKYKNKRLITNKTIQEGFKGLPKGPFDDVFKWNINKKIYFFRGSQYWKYDSRIGRVTDGYPKPISLHWKGIPNDIDAAFSSLHSNQTYFFKRDKYYRFDDINKRLVNDSNPPYPRETAIWFLRCRNTANDTKWSEWSTPHPLPTTSSIPRSSSSPKPVTIIIDTDIEYYESASWIILLVVVLAIIFECIVTTFIYRIFIMINKPSRARQIDQPSGEQQRRQSPASLRAIEMQSTDESSDSADLMAPGGSGQSNEVSVSYKTGRDPNAFD